MRSNRQRSRSRSHKRQSEKRKQYQRKQYQRQQPFTYYQLINETLPISIDQSQSWMAQLNELISTEQKELPIFNRAADIIQTISNNQVTIVSGDTGSGKSTQIPQYLYHFETQFKQNYQFLIVCAQPRRMAVLNLAIRLSHETSTKLGQIVGYQIGLEKVYEASAKIIYLTYGILLQKIVNDRNFLDTVSYLILDEIHERDIDSDFILLALQQQLSNYKNFKLILMSATIDNKLFSHYFGKDFISSKNQLHCQQYKELEDSESSCSKSQSCRILLCNYDYMQYNNPAPVIFITTAKMHHKISMFYLDDIPFEFQVEAKTSEFDLRKAVPKKEIYKACIDLIEVLIKKKEKQFISQGLIQQDFATYSSILIFLPGFGEIYQLQTLLSENKNIMADFELIPLHSSVSDQNCRKLNSKFIEDPRLRKRKIIISTNIAESSITVPDVLYVIDFCLTKQIIYDEKNQQESLELRWASQASLKQRTGRCGRVSDGICIRLIPLHFFEDLPLYSDPEMTRCSLDKVILRIKMLSLFKHANLFNDPKAFLSKALQPPKEKNIDSAIKHLIKFGGLTLKPPNIEITDLGKICSNLPLEMSLVKFCLYGIIYGVFEECVTIACIMQNQKAFFSQIARNQSIANYLKHFDTLHYYDKCQESDHIQLLNIFMDWEKTFYEKIELKLEGIEDQISELEYIFENFVIDKSQGDSYFEQKMQKIKLIMFKKLELSQQEQMRRTLRETQQFIKQKRFFLSSDEETWCKDRFLDPVNMHNILNLKLEIIIRLKHLKLELVEKKYNDDEKFKRIKFALQSAFWNQLYYGKKEENKSTDYLKQYIDLKLEPYRTIKITSQVLNSFDKSSEQIANLKKEWMFKLKVICQMLHSFQIHFGEVTQIYLFQTFAYIEFGSIISIKKLLFVKNLTSQQTLEILNEDKKSILIDLGDIYYYFKSKFYDFKEGCEISVMLDSLQYYHFGQFADKKTFFLSSFSFMVKKLTRAKFSSKLLPYPYLQQLLLLILPHRVSIHTGETQKYTFFKVGAKGRSIYLEFYLSNQEIAEINHLRKQFRQLIKLKNLLNLQEDFYIDMESFFSKERTPILDQNEYQWERIFFSSSMNIQNVSEFSQYPAINDPQPTDLNLKNGFVPDINYSVYRQNYLKWKQQQLEQIRYLKNKLNLNDCYIACGQCKELITKFTNLGEKKENLYEIVIEGELIEGVYRQDDKFYVKLYQSYKGVQFKLFACNNGHCFCFKPSYQQSYFLTDFSNLSLLYSDGTEEKLNISQFDKKEIQRKELQAYNRRSNLQTEFICSPCQIGKKLENVQKILTHFRSKDHILNEEQFEKLLT